MFKFSDDFFNSKTVWSGATAIIIAVFKYHNHELAWDKMFEIVMISLQAIFIRDTIARKLK